MDEPLDLLCRKIILHFTDANWSEHLADLGELREGIHLQRLGGQEPVVEFQRRAISLFNERLTRIDKQAIDYFAALKADILPTEDAERGLKPPSATWTYLVDDDPFESQMATLGAQLGNPGLGLGVAIFWPLMLVTRAIAKWRQRRRQPLRASGDDRRP